MQSITEKFLIDSKAERFDQSLNDPALAAARGRLCASMARQKLGAIGDRRDVFLI
jgi:hypothetical protein